MSNKRKTWEIRSIHHPVITVIAPNWLAALGAAMTELGLEEGLDRMACERLSNGRIIVNDVGRKMRFTVRETTKRAETPPEGPRSALRPEPPRRGPYLDWMLDGLRSIH
ncbi:MAG: hypothetical protein ACI8RZ_001076 [Myxococcota bacterium]|jgi:hypothetical protein